MSERIAFSLPGIPMVLVLLGAIIAARSRIVEGNTRTLYTLI